MQAWARLAGGDINTENGAHGYWVLLNSGKSDKGWDFGTF